MFVNIALKHLNQNWITSQKNVSKEVLHGKGTTFSELATKNFSNLTEDIFYYDLFDDDSDLTNSVFENSKSSNSSNYK